jgi:hypothetical protein
MRIFVPIVALTVHRTAGPESLQGEGFALSIRRRHLVFAAFSGSTAGSEKNRKFATNYWKQGDSLRLRAMKD